ARLFPVSHVLQVPLEPTPAETARMLAQMQRQDIYHPVLNPCSSAEAKREWEVRGAAVGLVEVGIWGAFLLGDALLGPVIEELTAPFVDTLVEAILRRVPGTGCI